MAASASRGPRSARTAFPQAVSPVALRSRRHRFSSRPCLPVPHDLPSPTNGIAVSDRGTLRGLTQFLRCSVSACPQTVECKSHRGTGRIEGGFCDRLFQAARKLLILNGEMSEWLKEHAWKTTPASCTE
jgi:hypothetical protein